MPEQKTMLQVDLLPTNKLQSVTRWEWVRSRVLLVTSWPRCMTEMGPPAAHGTRLRNLEKSVLLRSSKRLWKEPKMSPSKYDFIYSEPQGIQILIIFYYLDLSCCTFHMNLLMHKRLRLEEIQFILLATIQMHARIKPRN